MKFKLLIIFSCIAMFFIPSICSGDIGGDISFKYEIYQQNPGQLWNVNIYYTINEKWKIGFTEITGTNGYGTYFGVIPGFIPTEQLYEIYTIYNIDINTSIKISQWCLHGVDNGLYYDFKSGNGIYIQGEYKF